MVFAMVVADAGHDHAAVRPPCACSLTAQGRQASAVRPPETVTAVPGESRAVLDRYCVGCHSDRRRTGDLSLKSVDLTAAAGDAPLWEKVVRKLRTRSMPPLERPRPAEAEYDGLVSYLVTELDRHAVTSPAPGRTPSVHCLNRAEYANAVRDLLGIEMDARAALPPDDAGYGFDNIADLQPPTFLQDARLKRLPFGSRGGLVVDHHRRAPTEQDVGALLAVYVRGRADGDFDAGIMAALRGLLVDPDFLFRIERDPVDARPGDVYRITDSELASRLSFFLWSSIPDDELLGLAEQGRLTDDEVLERQVTRMLRDDRAMALVDNFAGQWLYLRNLRAVTPDPETFPVFDNQLRRSLQRETELFIGSLLREDRSVLDLLGASYTYLDERLARYYGVPDVYGRRFRRVELDDAHRFGVLGHGSVLTVTSYPTRTSPVLRGKWVLENLLGAPPPPPPPNVPDLPNGAADGSSGTVRARMEAHRANPVCASAVTRSWTRSGSPWRTSMPSGGGVSSTKPRARPSTLRARCRTGPRSTAWRGWGDAAGRAVAVGVRLDADREAHDLCARAWRRGVRHAGHPAHRARRGDARPSLVRDRRGYRQERAVPDAGGEVLMMITKRHLSRRTVLRGIGATVALPLLDGMVPALTAVSQTAARPIRRLGIVYVSNGVWMQRWTPALDGPLELALDPNELVGACDAGYSCAYSNTLSWRTATTPLPTEADPRAVFERLFGSSDSTDPAERRARLREDRSVLDAVQEKLTRLHAELGNGDRARLDEYLDAIRSVERRIALAEAQSGRELPHVERPIGIPPTFEAHAKLMFDLQVLAYQTDLTRVVTFMLGREVSSRAFFRRSACPTRTTRCRTIRATRRRSRSWSRSTCITPRCWPTSWAGCATRWTARAPSSTARSSCTRGGSATATAIRITTCRCCWQAAVAAPCPAAGTCGSSRARRWPTST